MKRSLPLHLALFLFTILSTYYVLESLVYSIAIMTILLSHEMGHYLISRKYGVPATLPYFIPFPFPPFGTLGAVIKMRGVIGDKKALFDIGVAGPLCGFLVSVPCVAVGIKLSTMVRLDPTLYPASLAEPLLFRALGWLLAGDLPGGYDLLLHPIGYAGWVGLFVTALNLLPIGQLDGGHVVYSVLGEKSGYVFRVLIPVLVLLSLFYNAGWLVLVLLLLIFGIRHPRPVDAHTPLDRKRKALALLMLLVFVLSFVPAPFPGTGLLELLKNLF